MADLLLIAASNGEISFAALKESLSAGSTSGP
jgi:hypothetical protein